MKRRIKVVPILAVLIIILGITFGIVFTVKTIKYHKTYEYKLLKVGYSKDEVKVIETLKDKNKDYILENEYNKNLVPIIKEKYFMEKNLKDYLEYLSDNDKSIDDVVAIVNVGSNKDWYTGTKKTDLSKGNLILTKIDDHNINVDTSHICDKVEN